MEEYIREMCGWAIYSDSPKDLLYNKNIPNWSWSKFETSNLNDVRVGDIIINDPLGNQ